MIKETQEELYELILEDEEDGVFANSLVAAGAIERDYVWLNKDVQFAAVSEEKMLVAGPMLIPNKKILRLTENGEKYYVYFSADSIEKISRKFMKKGYLNEVTLEHGNKTSGVYMVESWIIENPTKDKSNSLGFTLPRGTWFAIYSVKDNPQVWERVKAGEFNSYSIEGLFEHKKSDIKLALEKEITELSDIEAQMVLNKLINILKKDGRYKRGQRVDVLDLEATMPSIVSSYPGQVGPVIKKKKR